MIFTNILTGIIKLIVSSFENFNQFEISFAYCPAWSHGIDVITGREVKIDSFPVK